MVKKICVYTLALALVAPVCHNRAAENKMPTAEQMKEIRAIMANEEKQHAAILDAEKKLLRKNPVITLADKDSLSLNGYGFPSLNFSRIGVTEYSCQNGTLLVAGAEDFGQRYYYFAWDPARTFAVRLKEEQEALAPYFAMTSMTPDLRKRVQDQADVLHHAHSPADLEYGQAVQMYAAQLTGNVALTPAQLSKLSAFYGQWQQKLDDLQKLVVARDQTPKDAALQTKLANAYEKFQEFERTGVATNDFLSATQRRAMGLDDAAVRQHAIAASASASSAGEGVSAEDAQKMMSKLAQDENARMKKRMDKAKVKFALKGKEAGSNQTGFQLSGGTLYLYVDALADGSGANFVYYLDENETWEKQKTAWTSAYDASKPEGNAILDAIKQSTSSDAFQWSRPVVSLRLKQAVPATVEQHLAALIKEWDDAAQALEKAYAAVLAKPADAALQRELFEATRNAMRVQQRNNALASHADYGVLDEDSPWLLSTEQMDIVNAGQLTTSSEMNSSTDGTSISISARPAGGKQYLGIIASNATIGGLAEKVEQAAQKYYHNHKLKLAIDAAANDKPLKGMVEGKSAEELFKSFAQRAGLNLVKDEKDPNAYTVK